MQISLKTFATAAAALAITCTSPSAFAQSGPVSPSYLNGVWKENPQCRGNEALAFFPNSTMSAAGSQPVNYAVTGAKKIMMYGPGGAVPIRIDNARPNSMVVKFQGMAMQVYRCTANFNAPARPPHHAGVSDAYIVGRWSHNGNCGNPDIFSPGGHFIGSTHEAGRWAVHGNTLRIIMQSGNTADFLVQINGPRKMMLAPVHQPGNISTYRRC